MGTWDRNAATCLNAYCHSPSPTSDSTPTNVTPHWTKVGSGEAACGTCHGVPPASHADPPPGLDFAAKLTRCGACHQTTVVDGQLLPITHADGTVQLGSGPSGCSNCHGDASSPAPPKDTLGRTDERVATVGAHRAHLEARHQLRGPISCTECHQVPASLHEPGHIDHGPPAIVFPNISGVGILARTDGAQPSYDASRASCGGVYCHGNGQLLLNGDGTEGLLRNPVWSAGSSQAACGACHGLPPRIDPRNPLNPLDPHRCVASSITQCVTCHAASVTQSGSILINPDGSSTHIDGIVQVEGACP
jgi:predicted CxxxxCH...CXXCH cytochrome family protein